ncbi:MAG: L-aspartate oxidase [Candidatus Dormibacteria bacterium]
MNATETRCDLLVVGSGLAGLFAAIRAARDRDVILVTKGRLGVSNSFQAQGGIAAAISPEDSPEEHLADTLRVGGGICVERAVRMVVEEAPRRIDDLVALGVRFDGDPGPLELGLEAGHSRRRVLHAGGAATGARVIEVLSRQAADEPRLRVIEHARLSALLVGERCDGAEIEVEQGQRLRVLAAATLLATGGPCGLYRRTTNPRGASGEGLALAYLAGAQLADVEFIQFHPTAVVGHGIDGFLISEAVRGEGGRLVDENGERFMTAYHPAAELAPRDVVARAVRSERSRGREVFITMAHLQPRLVEARFANLARTLHAAGLDLAGDPVPVAPAAHFMMGGVRTDLDAQTSIPRLFAAGEVACHGTHGANRLASNGLLECLVFGERAVQASSAWDRPARAAAESAPWSRPHGRRLPTEDRGERPELGELLDLHAGVVRSGAGLSEMLDSMPPLLECTHTETVARLICEAALFRRESRGAHFRTDHPRADDAFHGHSSLKVGEAPRLVAWE